VKAYFPLVAGSAALVSLALAALTPGADAGSTKSAYYTSAQAALGAKAYQADCSRCHGVQLEGVSGPALKGSSMTGSQSIADIYGFVSQQMPAGAPGSLSASTYTAIMAYLLKENGHPAGATPLTPVSAKKISAKI
jgi:mono/diheme cytochrome c family protein